MSYRPNLVALDTHLCSESLLPKAQGATIVLVYDALHAQLDHPHASPIHMSCPKLPDICTRKSHLKSDSRRKC